MIGQLRLLPCSTNDAIYCNVCFKPLPVEYCFRTAAQAMYVAVNNQPHLQVVRDDEKVMMVMMLMMMMMAVVMMVVDDDGGDEEEYDEYDCWWW